MKKFKTVYDHLSVTSPAGGASMTDQQYVADCDILSIMNTFKKTGALPVQSRCEGISGDFSEVGDFQACLDRINRAKDEFMALPAEIRSRFGNDPAAYCDFVLNPDNNAECVKLGLKEEVKPVELTPTELLKKIAENTTTITPKGENRA